MRRKEKEIINRADIEKILQASRVCRLAMVADNTPYIVPMSFGSRVGKMFFHSAGQGQKIELIKKNPRVCFEVDQVGKLKKAALACDWGVEYKSVIGWGKAELVSDLKEKTAALNIIMAHYSGKTFEYPDKMLDRTLVIQVTIDRITGKQS